MTKSRTLFISILLILSAIIIYMLMHDVIPQKHMDLVGFYVGFTFLIGIGFSIIPFVKRKR